MYKKLITLMVFLVICFTVEVRAKESGTVPTEQKKERVNWQNYCLKSTRIIKRFRLYQDIPHTKKRTGT